MTKPELISFSDFLMIAPFYDQRAFFRPEIENIKGGIDAVMASGLIRSDDSEEEKIYSITGSVAVIDIEGPLRPGAGWYYSTGYGDIQAAIVELIDNKNVSTVIQKIDSPGGTVKQAFETHEMFVELSKEKTLISFVTGSATSAAALMTFPAKKRYLASKTAQTGSIGVVSQHVDNRSWYKEFWGEIRTSIAKGDFKDAGTDTRGYDAKAKDVFESAVTKLYDIFANEAVKGLNKTREEIDAMQSRVFIGEDGVSEGLADGFATLDELIESANQKPAFTPSARPTTLTHSAETQGMDKEKLKAEFPDVYQEILQDGKAAAKDDYLAQGVESERKRITGIDALNLPAEFASKMKADGVTVEQAAVKYCQLEKVEQKEVANKMEQEVNKPLASDVPASASDPKLEKSDPVADYNAAVAEKVEKGLSKATAMKEVTKEQPELHRKYIQNVNQKGE